MRAIIAAALLLPSLSLAQDLSRRVEGGDILYSGTGSASSLKRAILEAQSHAVRGLVVECGAAPAATKIFEQGIREHRNGFEVSLTVGVDFDSCERMQATPVKERAKYANQQLMKDFAGEAKPDGPTILEAIRGGFQSLTGKIEQVSEGVDRAHTRLDRIEDKLNQTPVRPVMQVSAVKPPSSSMCESQYQGLIQSAQMAALENYPPGNMAQGRARDLYNQAMMIRSSCR